MPKTSQKLAVLTLLALGTSIAVPSLPAEAAFSSLFEPTFYTPSGYIPPSYDSFDNTYYRPPQLSDETRNTPPTAEMIIINNDLGLQSPNRGTTATRFTFSAGGSFDKETGFNRLEARWDFENDGKLDSYFSQIKTIQHTFTKAGVYTVKLEILDTDGNIDSTTQTVTIANNTPPTANFFVRHFSNTAGNIFNFDTSRSSDDQYLQSSLAYRFDWNGDGKFDTPFERKTLWNHRFDKVGTQSATMEVRDPEGATARTTQRLTTNVNRAPSASFAIRAIPNSAGATFLFDASASSDDETLHRNLLYRWDFNYNGPDDIIYNTTWSSSDRYSGSYSLSGRKTIKLEVRDEDGAINTTFASIDVSVTPVVVQNFGTGLL